MISTLNLIKIININNNLNVVWVYCYAYITKFQPLHYISYPLPLIVIQPGNRIIRLNFRFILENEIYI